MSLYTAQRCGYTSPTQCDITCVITYRTHMNPKIAWFIMYENIQKYAASTGDIKPVQPCTTFMPVQRHVRPSASLLYVSSRHRTPSIRALRSSISTLSLYELMTCLSTACTSWSSVNFSI